MIIHEFRERTLVIVMHSANFPTEKKSCFNPKVQGESNYENSPTVQLYIAKWLNAREIQF